MSYDATQLSSSAIYRVRFKLQDNTGNEAEEFLSDAELDYLISYYNDNEDLATLDAARRILGQLSFDVREREGQVERYNGDAFKQYQNYLEELISELSKVTGQVIIGGVSAAEMDRVKCNPDSVGAGYERDYLDNQVTHTFGSSVKNTNRFLRSSVTSFKL